MNAPLTRMFGPDMIVLALSVNGERREVQIDPATTLAEVLRDNLGLTGTKIGCDRGACSACTVWVDGDVLSSRPGELPPEPLTEPYVILSHHTAPVI